MTKDFYDRIKELVKSPINETLQITKGTTPIPFFGDLEKSIACTISLNPSDREFYNQNGLLLERYESRLCYRKILGKKDNEELSEEDVEKVIEKCNSYFRNNPYRLWFDKIEKFLSAFDDRLSYYTSTVVGLDLVQWATTPKWAEVPKMSKQILLEQGLPFLKELLIQKNFEYIFLNGKTAFSEISDHLHIPYKTKHVNDGKNDFDVYLGKYNNSNVIGWSIYLQSAKGGGYDNIKKISYDVLNIYKNNKIT